jgi:hypothetical protein
MTVEMHFHAPVYTQADLDRAAAQAVVAAMNSQRRRY